jgi:phage baseplate assembly protein W
MENATTSFLGTGWSFPPGFNSNNGSVDLVSEVEDINQSLHILLSTSLGERVMQPDYGCNLTDYMFESLNSDLIGIIKHHVENSVLLYEPRIVVEKIQVTSADSFDLIEGKFLIYIEYIIPKTNSRFNYVYDFYLTEATIKV